LPFDFISAIFFFVFSFSSCLNHSGIPLLFPRLEGRTGGKMKTRAFSALIFLLFILGLALPLTWAADYIPQGLGMYDTIYELLFEVDCRSCHSASLAQTHHNLNLVCLNCHTQQAKKVDDCLDCHDGHDPESHHSSDLAASFQCHSCHDSTLIDDYHYTDDIPTYAPTSTTPRPYRCKKCHNSSPNPPGSGDPDPALVGIDGDSPTTNTHHNTRGEVFNSANCDRCHDHNSPHTDPYQIRYCERCHSPAKLHEIEFHSIGTHCQGCHSDTVVIQVLDVWTSNKKGGPKKKFIPGSKVRFNVKFRIISNPDVQHKVRLWGDAYSIPDRDWEIPLDQKRLQLRAGEYIRKWVEEVPLTAVPDTEAKVRVGMKVVDVGTTPYVKAKFFIK
jgi:hypothetical protein